MKNDTWLDSTSGTSRNAQTESELERNSVVKKVIKVSKRYKWWTKLLESNESENFGMK